MPWWACGDFCEVDGGDRALPFGRGQVGVVVSDPCNQLWLVDGDAAVVGRKPRPLGDGKTLGGRGTLRYLWLLVVGEAEQALSEVRGRAGTAGRRKHAETCVNACACVSPNGPGAGHPPWLSTKEAEAACRKNESAASVSGRPDTGETQVHWATPRTHKNAGRKLGLARVLGGCAGCDAWALELA